MKDKKPNEIAQCRKSEGICHDALEYANSIINTVREPLIVLDADLKVVSASRSFYQIFKVKQEKTEGQYIYSLGNGQWDIPQLRELLEDILTKTASFDDFEVKYDFPGIGRRIMLLNARKIYREFDHVQLILLAIEDVTERSKLEETLKALATHDELTGCVNFRSIMQIMENELSRSKRYQKKFSIIMIDIDHFKRINDQYGHLAGNDALTAFSAVLRNSVRSIDIVGRYGGEEFLVVLPESEVQHASVALARIRNNLEQTKITSPHLDKDQEFTLKFSAGIAVYPENATELKELIWFADTELRKTKQEGREA